jgi:hypothetical protein
MALDVTKHTRERFAVGIYLDHLWCQTMRLPIDDKESVLATVLDVLHEHRVPYAVIGGIAVQLYTKEPRTTADIDLAISSLADIPRKDLTLRGFKFVGLHAYTENWLGPAPAHTPRAGRVPVQFSYGKPMTAAVSRSIAVDVGFPLQLVTVPDLVELKLLAAESPDRKRSKQGQNAVDVMKLIEEHPAIGTAKIERRVRAALIGPKKPKAISTR